MGEPDISFTGEEKRNLVSAMIPVPLLQGTLMIPNSFKN